uniref:ER membrane protein complex subunit 4 n=1 Tax=Prasinoderma coloniale TaxID=156133 RepID=A0A7R9TZC2_9VIRI|eukprot:PRCOL_00000905-RA
MAARGKWQMDFGCRDSMGGVVDPLGYEARAYAEDESGKGRLRIDEAKLSAAKMKRAWATATKPVQSIGMMGFMLWMSGASLNIFSMMTVGSALWQPLSAVLKADDVFSPFADDRNNVLLPKLVYCLINFGGMMLGLWKLNTLGLLPTHVSDWESGLPPPLSAEMATAGVAL